MKKLTLLSILLTSISITACNSGAPNATLLNQGFTSSQIKKFQMNQEKINEIKFLKNIKILNHEGERLITLVGQQFYYQSTGVNSNLPGTIFPLMYIEYEGHFLKPIETTNSTVRERFIEQIKNQELKSDFVSKLSDIANFYMSCKKINNDYDKIDCLLDRDQHIRALFDRLYSLDDAIVSFQFGTGIWGDLQPASKFTLKQSEYIAAKYLEELFTRMDVKKSSYKFSKNPQEIIIVNYENEDLKNKSVVDEMNIFLGKTLVFK